MTDSVQVPFNWTAVRLATDYCEAGFLTWCLFPLEPLHGQEVAEMNVPNDACGIVKFIRGDQNLLGKRIEILERPELALICLVVGDAVGDLNIVFPVALLSKEVNLVPTAVVDMELVSHVQQLIVNNVFH